MARKFLSRLKALRRDDRGTAVIELALIAPFLAVLTIGIADFSSGMTRRLALSEAIHRTLEKATAGSIVFSPSATDPNYDFLKTEVVAAAGGAANDVTADDVTVTVWLECDGVEQPDFSTPCTADQATARYLQIRIDSYFEPHFGTVVRPGTDGKYPLWAEAAVRIQ